MMLPQRARGDDLPLPQEVEATLSSNVAAYDRSLAERAGDKVFIMIVARASDATSMHIASQMQSAFHDLGDIGGLPHEELTLPWKDGPALTAACTQHRAAIVFLAPGLTSDIDAIVRALQNQRVISIAGDVSYIEKGAVVGFDLVSGRPQIIINLPAAKSQRLNFRASLLKLAKVIE